MLSQSLGITCQSLTDRWEDSGASYFNLMTSWTFLRLFGRSDDMEKKFNSFWNEIRLWILRVVLRRECRDGENDASAFEIWFHKALSAFVIIPTSIFNHRPSQLSNFEWKAQKCFQPQLEPVMKLQNSSSVHLRADVQSGVLNVLFN